VLQEEYYSILEKGVKNWNSWREQNKDIQPFLTGADLRKLSLKGVNFQNAHLQFAKISNIDLSNADLSGAHLDSADLHQSNLSGTNFTRAMANFADFVQTNLSKANLSEAFLNDTNFYEADFTDANLQNAWLLDANLTGANLTRANLTDAKLIQTRLIETNLSNAILQNCWIYGVSVWNSNLTDATQSNLMIAAKKEDPIITVDNIEVAQFIFLLLNNKKIREVIDTLTTKMVLILGRFTEDRKKILDTIRDRLRESNYVPVLFDFEKPTNRDIVETVSTLAHMSRFVIADITDAAMIREELEIITRNLPTIPIQPILQSTEKPYPSFDHIQKFPGVLGIYYYNDIEELQKSFNEKIVTPPEKFLKKT
jgi:uncharacterized protein YjbI with pentapeptide repeats